MDEGKNRQPGAADGEARSESWKAAVEGNGNPLFEQETKTDEPAELTRDWLEYEIAEGRLDKFPAQRQEYYKEYYMADGTELKSYHWENGQLREAMEGTHYNHDCWRDRTDGTLHETADWDVALMRTDEKGEPIVEQNGEISWELADQDLHGLDELAEKFERVEGDAKLYVKKAEPFEAVRVDQPFKFGDTEYPLGAVVAMGADGSLKVIDRDEFDARYSGEEEDNGYRHMDMEAIQQAAAAGDLETVKAMAPGHYVLQEAEAGEKLPAMHWDGYGFKVVSPSKQDEYEELSKKEPLDAVITLAREDGTPWAPAAGQPRRWRVSQETLDNVMMPDPEHPGAFLRRPEEFAILAKPTLLQLPNGQKRHLLPGTAVDLSDTARPKVFDPRAFASDFTMMPEDDQTPVFKQDNLDQARAERQNAQERSRTMRAGRQDWAEDRRNANRAPRQKSEKLSEKDVEWTVSEGIPGIQDGVNVGLFEGRPSGNARTLDASETEGVQRMFRVGPDIRYGMSDARDAGTGVVIELTDPEGNIAKDGQAHKYRLSEEDFAAMYEEVPGKSGFYRRKAQKFAKLAAPTEVNLAPPDFRRMLPKDSVINVTEPERVTYEGGFEFDYYEKVGAESENEAKAEPETGADNGFVAEAANSEERSTDDTMIIESFLRGDTAAEQGSGLSEMNGEANTAEAEQAQNAAESEQVLSVDEKLSRGYPVVFDPNDQQDIYGRPLPNSGDSNAVITLAELNEMRNRE